MFGTNPFKAIPKKSEPKKTPAKKPAVGKKPKTEASKKLPAKKVTCPYCKAVNLFPEGKASRYCGECGKAYFR